MNLSLMKRIPLGDRENPPSSRPPAVRVDASSRKEGKRRDACERDGGKTGRRRKEHDGRGGSESFFIAQNAFKNLAI